LRRTSTGRGRHSRIRRARLDLQQARKDPRAGRSTVGVGIRACGSRRDRRNVDRHAFERLLRLGVDDPQSQRRERGADGLGVDDQVDAARRVAESSAREGQVLQRRCDERRRFAFDHQHAVGVGGDRDLGILRHAERRMRSREPMAGAVELRSVHEVDLKSSRRSARETGDGDVVQQSFRLLLRHRVRERPALRRPEADRDHEGALQDDVDAVSLARIVDREVAREGGEALALRFDVPDSRVTPAVDQTPSRPPRLHGDSRSAPRRRSLTVQSAIRASSRGTPDSSTTAPGTYRTGPPASSAVAGAMRLIRR
jgi:hypothetical protein